MSTDTPTLRPTFPELWGTVGRRIKALRTRRDMSLSALAAATGLGKGTISELERGQRNPTLDSLFAIATALSAPLSDLLLTDGAEEKRGEHPPSARGQSVEAYLIGRWTELGETIEVYRMTIRAGRRRSKAHAAGVVETISVLSGRIEVGPSEAPVQLREGGSHTFAADRGHIYNGLSQVSTTILIMRYPNPAPVVPAISPTTDMDMEGHGDGIES